ncbi:YutD family protein [Dellaglioa sp. P0083]|uniref:YutD family protein n=1 Tax=Dellaglioa kimchii TaxID=3344667 RepID=UPI0038D4FF9D
MNQAQKEKREQQLAIKAEKIKAYASDVVRQSETRVLIDNRPYDLVSNYRDGFEIEKLTERFSQILTKYDYIVGDWGYDQLRLRGFYKTENKKAYRSQCIDTLEDYLYEYCNFGCSYFVLHNLEIQKPEPISNPKERKKTVKPVGKKRKPVVRAHTTEKKYQIKNKKTKVPLNKSKPVKPQKNNLKTTTKRTKKHEFVIRQKDKA